MAQPLISLIIFMIVIRTASPATRGGSLDIEMLSAVLVGISIGVGMGDCVSKIMVAVADSIVMGAPSVDDGSKVGCAVLLLSEGIQLPRNRVIIM